MRRPPSSTTAEANAPDVSVVVPTFRRPAPLVEALKSALGQAGVRVEAWVLDDCPQGSAERAVASLGDARVRYLRQHPPSGGNPAVVRNEGLRLCSGRYVHFLDDDDQLTTGAYRRLMDELDEHPGCAAAFGRIEPFGEHPAQLELHRRYFDSAARRARFFGRWGSRRLLTLGLLFTHTVLFTSAGLFRRAHLAQLGGFDPACLPMEDVELFARAFRRFGGRFVDQAMLRYRTGAPSILHDQPGNQRIAAAYRRIYANYRREHGALELRAMQLLARTVLRGQRGVAIPR